MEDVDKLSGLLAAAAGLAVEPDITRLGQHTLEELARLTGARGGSFYVRLDHSLSLSGCLDPGHAPNVIPLPLSTGSLLERAERRREPLLIQVDAGVGSGWKEYRSASALIFPLVDPVGTVHGFVSLHDKPSAPFAAADLNLGRVLASLAAAVLAWQLTAEALGESEERYREVFQHSSSGIALFDVTPDMRFKVVSLNPAVVRMTGLRAEETTGKFLEDALSAETAGRLTAHYQRCIEKGHPVSVEDTLAFPAGVRDYRTVLIPLRGVGGRIHRLITLPTDITDKRAVEEALKASEQRYREVFENTSDGVFVLDVTEGKRFRVVAYNPVMEKIAGISNARAMGKLNEEILDPETAAAVNASNERCLAAGAPVSFDEERQFPGGHFFLHTTLVPVRDTAGRICRLIGVVHDVTETARISRALAQSEAKFSKAFHASPDAMAISRLSDGVFLDVNKSFLDENGYSRDEVIGRSSLPSELQIWPSDEARSAWMRALREKGEVTAYETSTRRKDGSSGWVLLSARVMEIDGEKCVLTIARDVTGRKRMEEALRESEARFREIVENTSDGIFVVEVTPDQRFQLLSYNPAQERMLGISARYAVGKYTEEYLPAESVEKLNEDNRACIAAGHPMTFERALDLPIGRRYYITTLVPVRDDTGRIARLIGVSHDDTERREQERELLQAAKLASLGTLVSGIGHEINNPNNFIRLNSQNLKELWGDIRGVLRQAAEKEPGLALRGIPLASAEKMVEDLLAGVEEGSKRIEKLLVNLRNFSRGDQGDLTESVDLNEVVRSAVMITANLIKKSTESFTVQEAPDLPRIRGNYHQIEQVLINLITNACQALLSRDRAISIATRADGDGVLLEVEDGGVGIPSKNIARVTDPFFTTKRAQGGSGLGLAVSSRIVANHGGTMSFTSIVDAGTRVVVRLPVAGGQS